MDGFEANPDQIQAIQNHYHHKNEFLVHQLNILECGSREWNEECKRHVTRSKNTFLVHRGKKLQVLGDLTFDPQWACWTYVGAL